MKHPPRFPHEPAPPRPSEPTRVGLGAPETRHASVREDAITPPRGLVREELAEALTRGDAELYVQRLQSVEGKVDTLITDHRTLTRSVNAVVDRLEEQRTSSREMVTRLHARCDAHDTVLGQIVAELSATRKENATMREAITALDTRIGRAPEKIDMLRASQVGDLTAAEMTAMEQGTGLLGLVARLIANDARLAQSIARSAGTRAGAVSGVATAVAATAPQWIPALADLLSRF